jgi:nitrogen regulatory protein P-II 1
MINVCTVSILNLRKKEGNGMKRIEAIIRPEKESDVCAALDRVGHPGVTISEIKGHGRQKGTETNYRGVLYKVGLVAKMRVEVVVQDEDLNRIITAIRDAALTGKMGDGKIFVHDMADAIRIRTNETGMAAI